jgi:transcriptional regulator with XRE-family HTH domain
LRVYLDTAQAASVDEKWPEPQVPIVLPYPYAGLLRAARRRADMSQRELGRAARVNHATIGKIESGQRMPGGEMFRTLIEVLGFQIVVIDGEGCLLQPMLDRDDLKDGAERRYPAHLDVIADPLPGEWWGDLYGLARPPETFHRDRAYRDSLRKRSQWEVRVAKHRNDPEPPNPRYW